MLLTCSGWCSRTGPPRPYHAVDDEGVPIRDIAAVIGRRLNLRVVSKTPEEPAQHFGWFAHFCGDRQPARQKVYTQQLGWLPKQPALLDDSTALAIS